MQNQQFGIGGVRSAVFTTPREILWGGDASRQKILRLSNTISNAARDAGNDVTTVLRPGLLLGMITASSKLAQWDPAASDGTQWFRGVNEHELRMTEGISAVAADVDSPYFVKAPLKAAQLLVLGTALTSSAHQYLARKVLFECGFDLDDDPMGYLSGLVYRSIAKTATGTITAAENGATFIVKGAAAVTLTLPAIATGLRYKFLNIATQNLIIASNGSSDDLVVLNDLAADSIMFSTANNQIGAQAEVYSDYVDGTLKWITTVQIGTATLA